MVDRRPVIGSKPYLPLATAVPYFAHRPAIDLLGKNDRRIARLPGRHSLVPGHDKWDYGYSIGELRPDVVVGLWRPAASDFALLDSLRYQRLPNDIYVRGDTPLVDRAALGRLRLR
jgi:hypothetical protein